MGVRSGLDNKIVHICRTEDWEITKAKGYYESDSLTVEGFIHCSRPDQVLKVANSYYPGAPDLVLFWIEPQRLTSEIRWETSGEEVFPHLYGPLNLEAIISVVKFHPNKDGVFRRTPDPE
jgi:uncharacterized protein (DUF952 family)